MKSNHTSENAVMPVMPFNSKELTMSSREIAELTQKEHKNVLRVVRDLISAQILDAQIEPLKFEYRNQLFDYYELNKRDSLVLVARLSPEFTAAIVDRWQELENQIRVPKTLPEALRAYADECERTLQLEQKIKQDAPKVAFIEHYVMSGNSKSIRETAKILKMPEKALVDVLIRDKFLYRQSGNLLPYARSNTAEYFTVKTGSAENGHAYTQTRVTAKGVSWIAQRYASELMIN